MTNKYTVFIREIVVTVISSYIMIINKYYFYYTKSCIIKNTLSCIRKLFVVIVHCII